MRAVIVLALLAGCSDLPDLGTCGNGVIEADNGEACDGDISSEDSCSATCELLCLDHPATGYVVVSQVGIASGGNEQYCPDERMACGLDGICRAPSGQFSEPQAAQPFDVKQAISGDFDGDGVADLIGTSATQIVVRLGAAATPFTDGFEEAAPSAESPLALFDRDPGGAMPVPSSMAIAVPTDGLALLTSDTEVFGPDLDLIFDVDDAAVAPFVVRDPDPALDNSDAVYAVAKMGGQLGVQRLLIAPPHIQLSLAPCGPVGSNQRLISVAVARDRASFVVVSKPAAANNVFFACTYAPVGNSFQMTQTTINSNAPDSAILAQVDADPCPDLVVAKITGTSSTTVGAVLATPGTCAFGTTVTPMGTTPSSDTLLDAGSIVPRGGVERDEIVMTSGVFETVNTPPAIQLVIGPTSDITPWATAAVVDLNGDGIVDVVAGRKGQDDIDVVRGGVVPNVYRADTASSIVDTVAGDFDGDLLGDVALIEFANGLERVSIVYGTHDGVVGAPVVNSKFGGTIHMQRLRRAIWAGTAKGIDGVEDLIVTRASEGLPTKGGVLVGDAARLMTTLRIPPPENAQPPIPIGIVAVGKLTGTDELFAGALRVEDRAVSTGNSKLRLNNISTTAWLDSVTVTGFEVDTSRASQILRTSGTPLIAAFARSPTNTMTKFGAVEHTGAVCSATLTGVPFSFRTADVDGNDEIDELVVTVDAGKQVHAFPVTAGSPCTIGNEILADALATCADVAKAGDQTVALCPHTLHRYGLFRISDGKRDATPFVTFDGVGIRMVTGDYDGDGVPDLAVAIGRGAEFTAAFVRQCPSHDVRGCN